MARSSTLLLRGLRALLLVAASLHGFAHAGLFDDEEARKAILDLRQRVEAGRQAQEAALQRFIDNQRDSQTDQLRRSAEEIAVLRRGLLDLQNQIESMRAEVARLTGLNEQSNRSIAELQMRQKDLAMVQQDMARGVDERVRQLEPVKVTVDGREIQVEPAERRSFDAALASFRSGDFAAAQSGFLALMSRYPKTGYMPSALFWLGNAQYATRDYKEAITNFRILLQAAPEHLRAPEALLSVANCQIELKDVRGARKSLEDLGKAYPQSEAAQAGKERLARLR
jgi:tol-pal system protein YbgF